MAKWLVWTVMTLPGLLAGAMTGCCGIAGWCPLDSRWEVRSIPELLTLLDAERRGGLEGTERRG